MTKESKMINRLKQKEVETDDTGILYVGHLPYGFVENGLKEYFSQYGEVLDVKLGRSKKTARSKGYAFIQFKFLEVAQIAAKALNGYIMMGKQLVCSLVQDKNPFNFKETSHQYQFINWAKKFREEKNKKKTKEQMKKHVTSLIQKEQEKLKQLKDLNINYKYPGFQQFI